ncbi:serine/threonine-protein kinase ulk4 [Plakobranchus ocellatus]|uniref:Serine/threonine-protein kinase ulk4 n=1 Tax=Plakobranchus ocellatus TaxID=259542 RepID=A0AAV4D114_9GAST|nr:serine/threonine-protein kinase ulk4 [Plakobranchus ocellatus]
MYMLSKCTSLEEISLRFFETNHGQNEGDSLHSAITQALKIAGVIFLSSQLTTIFALAWPKQPYVIHSLQWDDFWDLKSLSKDLRVLEARRGSDAEQTNWNDIMEMYVTKSHLETIFVKPVIMMCNSSR